MKNALHKLMVRPDGQLIDAMRTINDGGLGIAFVCDDAGRVLGSLTDGDLRRAILSGSTLESRCLTQCMTRSLASVREDAGRAEVLDMMRALSISQVPVLNSRGHLIAVHLLHEMVGAVERQNWCVIMAGGKGTRLSPLTETVPKPMIPVAGRPILERLVLHLVGHGVRRIFLAVNHLAHVIEDHFGDGTAFGCRIEYLREMQPMGTGGALSLLPEHPTEPILVLNGDLVTEADIGAVLEFHERDEFAATFCVRPYSMKVPFGVAETCGSELVGLREKPSISMLVNAGIYVLSPDCLGMIPEREFPITDLFIDALGKRMRVGAHLIEDDWTDVGQHDELRRARGEL